MRLQGMIATSTGETEKWLAFDKHFERFEGIDHLSYTGRSFGSPFRVYLFMSADSLLPTAYSAEFGHSIREKPAGCSD